MIPRFETISEKKLVGKYLQMSFRQNRTAELWKSFMPHRKEIVNVISGDLYSLSVYCRPEEFLRFDPETIFEKWALSEVSRFESVPEGMKTFILPSGLYAIFKYAGLASQGESFFRYIFETWLPASDFNLDDRPHFELLGSKYRNEDPSSEEEIWIPVRPGRK